MKCILPAAAILALLILPKAAQAQQFDSIQLAKVEMISVSIDDKVKNGCLPSPNVLKVEAELILRRSGITVTDDGNAYKLLIGPFGDTFGDLSICVGNIDIILGRRERLTDETSGFVIAASLDWSTVVWPKTDFQNQLRKAVNQQVNALANEILKARANQ